jgi:hypothetical protein
MSYRGGGIGNHENGIATPIEFEMGLMRIGLGYFLNLLPYVSCVDPYAMIVSHCNMPSPKLDHIIA